MPTSRRRTAPPRAARCGASIPRRRTDARPRQHEVPAGDRPASKDASVNGCVPEFRCVREERPSRPSDAEDFAPSPSRGGRKATRGVGRGWVIRYIAPMKGQTNPVVLRTKLQRRLRNASTDAEHALWQRLRLRQLDGCKFRRQHPFGDYIIDFVCLERKLVVELDGSQHAESTTADARRTACLEHAGFTVLRFWNHQVFDEMDGVLEVIWQALKARANPSPPLPSP